MENKKQTAVEGLEKAFYSYAESTGINSNKWLIDEEDLDKLIQQAKEMDKQQKIEDYRSGRTDQQSDKTSKSYNRRAADYYKETYGE
jgi:hypothetical protein